MTKLADTPQRYGAITRLLHWGMAVLFLAQFASALARWGLPRGHELREVLWGYHVDLGIVLFLLIMLRGLWGLINLRRRPAHHGLMGKAAALGHLALYGLMFLVPFSRVLSSIGGTRGFEAFGLEIAQARETAVAGTQWLAEWHGEMGWALAALVLGHIAFAVIWHHWIKKDDTLARMSSDPSARKLGQGGTSVTS